VVFERIFGFNIEVEKTLSEEAQEAIRAKNDKAKDE